MGSNTDHPEATRTNRKTGVDISGSFETCGERDNSPRSFVCFGESTAPITQGHRQQATSLSKSSHRKSFPPPRFWAQGLGFVGGRDSSIALRNIKAIPTTASGQARIATRPAMKNNRSASSFTSRFQKKSVRRLIGAGSRDGRSAPATLRDDRRCGSPGV